MTQQVFSSFEQMINVLHDDTSCRQYLEQVRWGGIPTCPHCNSQCHYVLRAKGIPNGNYKCKDCQKRYNALDGTMFEGSHIPLRKWFIAIYIFSLHKKGISSHQLASDLGIGQKAAWFLLSRIRNAFAPKGPETQIDGLFQIDECFVGGKNKNRHADKKIEESQGRSVKDKTPVLGIMQTGGKLRTAILKDTKEKTIKPIIKSMVASGAIIVTDEWTAYKNLHKDYDHVVINHKENEYVRGGFHNNGIEGFWSLFKRGIFGIYHQVSKKHIHRYCDEFSFRYNSRKEQVSEKFNYSLLNSSRLTYQKLIAQPNEG